MTRYEYIVVRLPVEQANFMRRRARSVGSTLPGALRALVNWYEWDIDRRQQELQRNMQDNIRVQHEERMAEMRKGL
jgi:hypothetical protein